MYIDQTEINSPPAAEAPNLKVFCYGIALGATHNFCIWPVEVWLKFSTVLSISIIKRVKLKIKII